MSEEILINISQAEARAALVENGLLQEVHIERTEKKGIVGNLYKGRVARVLPGMQAAFVDIGLARTGFIHANDIASINDDGVEDRTVNVSEIGQSIREGQTLVVQVIKDPIGSKGARLTTHLSLSARYLVYMPFTRHIGISTRIDDEDERHRLKDMVEQILSDDYPEYRGGFIIRTAAEGVQIDKIKSDLHFLIKLWGELELKIKRSSVPSRIHEDLPLFMRMLRDLAAAQTEKVRIDADFAYRSMMSFAKSYAPEIVNRLEYYTGERPLLDLYGIEDEIKKALDTKVPLKSGGYLIIEQTEAMSTIDVNTGAFVGHRNLEETLFKTNLEAATAIGRQLRLRNLGGIIIIDFIDMKDEEHQRQVVRTLEKVLERDYAKTSITGVSELGLVEMTRKRIRESLSQTLCEACPVCKGRGRLKSSETVCYEIFREIQREAKAYDNDKYLVLASQVIIDRLLDEESTNVADLEEFIGRPIQFQVEPSYNQEQYDIILV